MFVLLHTLYYCGSIKCHVSSCTLCPPIPTMLTELKHRYASRLHSDSGSHSSADQDQSVRKTMRYEKYPLMVIPPNRKIIVGILLCSGVFIIVAALLRCVMSLLEISQIDLSAVWTVREIVCCSRHYRSLILTYSQSSWPLLPSILQRSNRCLIPRHGSAFQRLWMLR
jgi:hypothetical protein